MNPANSGNMFFSQFPQKVEKKILLILSNLNVSEFLQPFEIKILLFVIEMPFLWNNGMLEYWVMSVDSCPLSVVKTEKIR